MSTKLSSVIFLEGDGGRGTVILVVGRYIVKSML